MKKMHRLLILLFMFGLLGCASNNALVLYQQGQKALEEDRYDDAIEHFDKSLKIYQSYNLDEGVAANLVNIGKVYKSLDKDENALYFFSDALVIYKKLNNSEGIATSLTSIGLAYQSLKKYEDALSYHNEALEIYKKLNIPQHIATSLNNIGGVHEDMSEHEKALKYYEDSLRIRKMLNIPADIAISLTNIASVYFALGNYDKALQYYEEALKINRKLDIKKRIVADLNKIGHIYNILGYVDKAMKYHMEALQIVDKINKQSGFKDLKSIATTFNNMAHVSMSRGHYADALRNFELVLKIDERLNNKEGIALTLHNIAGVYYELGQYDNAMKFCEKAFNLFKEITAEKHIHLSYSLFGSIYSSVGQYDKALQYYEESLKFRKESDNKHDIAIALNNIGDIYHSIGKYNEALKYREESLKIYKELNIPKGILSSYLNIGATYLLLKDYKKAEGLYRTTEKEYMKIDSTTRIGTPLIVDVYIATGKFNDALKALRDEMPPNLQDATPYKIQYYTQKGIALKGTGNIKNASEEFLKAVTLSEEMRQRVKGEKSGFFGAGSSGGRIRAYIGLISTLAERAMSGERIDNEFVSYGKDLASAAFYFAESTKARTLLEQMAQFAKKSQRADIPEDLRQKEESLANRLSAIENQWEDAYKKGEDALKELIKRKEEFKKELDSLIAKLRKEYPRYAALNYPKPIPAEELPLKEDEVLLEYAIGDDAGYLFVVRKGGVKKLIKIPVSKEDIEAKIKGFMEPMNTKQHERFSAKEAKALYDILLAEAIKDIKDKGKIIIVPDGILGLLPFEALVMKEGSSIKNSLYVGDRYIISYYQSATVLALQRTLKDVNPEKTLFALGNPVYSKEDPRYIAWKEKKNEPLLAGLNKYPFRGLAIKAKWGKTTAADTAGKDIEFQPLPETEIEIKNIAKIMDISPQQPDILLSVSANETELRKANLDKYKYIHFATHASLPGMIQGVNEPFILLGQVENKDKDDGFFRMSEVLDLKLNADMVVLSACVTGVGKEVEGEGVSNFARAFQHAGAKGVVVSLWEVASEPAVEYMKIIPISRQERAGQRH